MYGEGGVASSRNEHALRKVMQSSERKERMKKLMVLVAMMAMMLVAAAPAFAQTTAIQFDDNTDNSINTEISTNALDLTGSQTSFGDVNAASVDGDATANIGQDLIFEGAQLNSSFNTVFFF